MEIFLDTADVNEISFYKDFIDGVTTNPTLMSKISNDYKSVAKDICAMIDGPVSVEVTSQSYDDMLVEAQEISEISENVCVKLPCTMEGMKICKILSEKGVMTNMTLCFSPLQALIAAKSGATYVSPFVGRIDDLCQSGVDLVENIVSMYSAYGFETRVLAASIRSVQHFASVAQIGVDAATVPAKVLKQCLEHPLTEKGLEIFTADWEKSKK